MGLKGLLRISLMKNFIWKHKKWFGYAFYGILLTIGLLYDRFPSEAVQDYVQATLDRTNPQLDLSIERVSPSVTFGLKFQKTELSQKADPDRIFFRADRLLVRPSVWSLLKGKFELCFDGLVYGGALKGCVDFGERSVKSPLTASIVLKDIRMDDHDNLPDLIGRQVKGRLGGTITYSGQSNALINGTGEADLKLSEGLIELLQPILMLESIDFNELVIKMILKNQRVNLTQVELKGPNMRGTLSGVVSLRNELLKSTLNLRGTIEPFADFFKSLPGTRDTVRFFKQRLKRGKLSFMIHGTLKEPQVKFI